MINKLITFKEVESTHKLALKMIENQEAQECVILAEKQTGGIGRCERQWVSAEGNLYSSIIRKITPQRDISKNSLAVACAVHESLCKYISDADNLSLHWPNDIYYKNLKISGILITVIENWVVISIGVNVYSVNVSTATSLSEICPSNVISVQQLLEDILITLDKWIYLPNFSNFSCIRKYWLQNIYGLNSPVTIKNGTDSLCGIMRGIDKLGRLILETNEQNLHISTGDMFVNEKKITVAYE